jgi:hypothetical protein
MSTRHLKGLLTAALAAVTAFSLASCGYDVDSPAVVWPDGEPAGPWEDDPWVQAVREADLQFAIAAVTLDYTSEGLADVVGVESAADSALGRQADSFRERWGYPIGPRPMVVLDVEESEDGSSAIVSVCQDLNWWIDPDQPEPPDELNGTPWQREVTLDEEGNRTVAYYGGGSGPDATCDMSEAARGYFDPLPDPYATYAPEEVKEPAP